MLWTGVIASGPPRYLGQRRQKVGPTKSFDAENVFRELQKTGSAEKHELSHNDERPSLLGSGQAEGGPMKASALVLSAAVVWVAALLVSCGGGAIKPPPPSGNYSNASLHGQYAFTLSGVDLTGGYAARVGSFTADGAGNITGGLQDVLQLTTGQPAAQVSFSGGHYSVQANGRGQVVLTVANGGAQLEMSIAFQSLNAGFAIETDLNATSNGTFDLQTSADFTTGALANPYVFQLSGVAFSGANAAPINMIGKITTDGNGGITGGVMDTSSGFSLTPSGATAVTPSTYALDTNGNGTNFGRGMLALNGRTFGFYIVDGTHFKMLEEDNLGGTAGDALQQTGVIPTQNGQFTGGFVYQISAVSVITTGSLGPVTRVARFTADGNGGIGSISLDDNNDGRYTHISQGGSISAATYSIDAANAGSGRGRFTFNDSGLGTFADTFYMISPAQAVVQENSKGIIGTGPMFVQSSGPFTLANLAGTFVTSWNGVQLGSTSIIAFDETFVSQYTLANTNSSNISGTVDYTELGVSSKTLYSSVGLAGNLTLRNDGTTNNLYKFALNGSPAITVNFQAYFANPSTVLLVCSDGIRTTSGIVFQQQ
jgi:hypothetical protein